MCGILSSFGKSNITLVEFTKRLAKIQSRGPDDSAIYSPSKGVILGFNRLIINGNDDGSAQPFKIGDITLICNGEIFNHRELEDELNYSPISGSDCEVLIAAYHRWGPLEMCNHLDAEFAFVLYDRKLSKLVAARDPYGVRPLFISNEGLIASELKAIAPLCAEQFKPGYVYCEDNDTTCYTPYRRPVVNAPPGHDISPPYPADTVYTLLCHSVKKRMMCENGGVCCLLSGGLDSSLVASLAQRYSTEPIHTFSIGLPGSPDLKYARIVADHIGSVHHEVLATEDEFIGAIPHVIRAIESYDTTTVRASVGNYLIAKHIRENTQFKVVLNGDYADEVFGGYLYLRLAPSDDEFGAERNKLLNNIHYFDSLRSDRCICAWGLEARAPYADKSLVEYVLRLRNSITSCRAKQEKWILRSAFDGMGLIPDAILWRQKEAFSDGVSNTTRSWYRIAADAQAPLTEDEYYKKVFVDAYGDNNLGIIPYKWMPKWGDATDPSARTLKIYNGSS